MAELHLKNDGKENEEPQTFWISPHKPIPAQTIALPAADQIGIAIIQPVMLCYKTTSDFHQSRFIEAVKRAAAGVAWEVPALAGSVEFEDQTCRRIKCVVPEDPKIQVRIKHSPYKDANQLDAGHWPPHAFQRAEVCLSERPTLGIGTYNFGVQANIIKGGIIIVLHMNHTILDGSSQGTLYSLWAHHLSRALDGEETSFSGLVPAQALNKSTAYGTHPARPITAWKDWRQAPQNTMSAEAASAAFMEKMTKLTLTIWHISAENQAKLRAASQDPAKSKLTFTACLSTWLWRAFTRARKLPLDTITRILHPVQVRGRVEGVHPNYSGSALVYGRAKATASELRTLNSHQLAQRIGKSVNWWTSKLIREFWGSIEDHTEKESVSTIQSNTNRDFGTDLEVSNGSHIPFYKLHWGKGLEVRAIRFPGVAFTDGWILMLPKLADGGIDMLVYSARDTLSNLIKDPEFRRYAVYYGASDPKIDQQVAEAVVEKARL